MFFIESISLSLYFIIRFLFCADVLHSYNLLLYMV